MERGKRIVLVSHCILNQNSVVKPLARAKGAYKTIVDVINNENIGILQLPCPELIHLGLKRPPMSKEAYDTKAYRDLCKDLLSTIMIQLKAYRQVGYEIVGLIGIDESPTCSLSNKGILMEELFKCLQIEKIDLRHISVPTSYLETQDTSFAIELKDWLNLYRDVKKKLF
ncbi:CD3072 family TudS-related putative desulfidase [Acidaminobacter sp. JC074]|uniref:CD3072 family TudS-related putative desulfidase n=1 Tax=Acidaminobacter sp. JC074 TaxID=2530199 RepID=UPI001F0EDA4B|nr:CD3072 family TudS-related putative desulfidase [Acidaminobacter sp. JC074]